MVGRVVGRTEWSWAVNRRPPGVMRSSVADARTALGSARSPTHDPPPAAAATDGPVRPGASGDGGFATRLRVPATASGRAAEAFGGPGWMIDKGRLWLRDYRFSNRSRAR